MDKYIFIKRKVLPKDYCENLIEGFEKSDLYDNPRGDKCEDVFFNTDSDFSFISDFETPKILIFTSF